jgi:hypothetical protein
MGDNVELKKVTRDIASEEVPLRGDRTSAVRVRGLDAACEAPMCLDGVEEHDAARGVGSADLGSGTFPILRGRPSEFPPGEFPAGEFPPGLESDPYALRRPFAMSPSASPRTSSVTPPKNAPRPWF